MKTPILFLALLFVLAIEPTLNLVDAQAAAHPSLDEPTTALLIIDIQDFYFPGGSQPLVQPEPAAANAGRLLAAFRSKGRTILHVGHKVPAGGEFHSAVVPLPGELIVMKSEVNSFRDTDLLKHLQEAGIEQLVICGMQTHMCLEGAVRAAVDYGFACLVIDDACATRDLTRGGVVVPAEGVHQATLATIDGIYAEVMSAADFLGEN